MGFFDKVKELGTQAADAVKELGAQAADAAQDVAEIGKYKLKISEAESEFKSTVLEIANKLFDEHPDVLEQFFPEEFTKLKDLKSTVASLKEQIDAVKGNAEEVVEDVVEDASPVDETPASE